MPTYDNPTTLVVHWIPYDTGWWVHTACYRLAEFFTSWDHKQLDPVGHPTDVTCCKCRETAAWLDAIEAEGGK